MTEFTTLLSDLVLVESPRWHDGRLIFSDWGSGEVLAAGLDGTRELITRIDAIPFCLDHLPDGRLLVVAGDQLLVRAPGGTLDTYAELAALSTKPWNDIVSDGRGNAYVNNIGFDFPEGEFAPGLIALVSRRRDSSPGCRRPCLPERHGNHARQLDVDRGGVLRRRADRVRHCSRWRSFQSSRVGRA